MATQVQAKPHPGGSSQKLRGTATNLLAQLWPWLFLAGLFIYFSIEGQGFSSARSISNILVSSTLVMLMAVGQTYVIVTGGIDLSIGWTVGLSSVIFATVARDLSQDGMDSVQAIGIGIVAAIGACLLPGLINGILIAKIKVPPFIATLGMFGVIRGVAILLTSGKNVVGDIPQNVRNDLSSFGNGSLLYRIPKVAETDILTTLSKFFDAKFAFFTQPENLERLELRALQKLLPYPAVLTAIVVIVFAFILARTQFGRHIYAIGGNKEAAKRAGINVDNNLIVIYILCAFTASIAGILHVFRFTAGSPLVGEPALLDSVAAVVIGGTSLFGGEGKISGTVVGALIIAVLESGLTNLAVDSVWKFIIVGIVIIVAVLVNQAQAYLEKQQVTAGAEH